MAGNERLKSGAQPDTANHLLQLKSLLLVLVLFQPGSVGSESISSRSVWGDTLQTVERGLVTAAK